MQTKSQNHKANKFHKHALITATAPATTPDITCYLRLIHCKVEITDGAKASPLSIYFLRPWFNGYWHLDINNDVQH